MFEYGRRYGEESGVERVSLDFLRKMHFLEKSAQKHFLGKMHFLEKSAQKCRNIMHNYCA
jgi:hypothetical protein